MREAVGIRQLLFGDVSGDICFAVECKKIFYKFYKASKVCTELSDTINEEFMKEKYARVHGRRHLYAY